MNFGQTWWGEQWLAAFNGIDYSNRLPRGRTYANKGSVTRLQISDTQVSASVKGSRRQPYNVTIGLNTFSPAQQADILTLLTQSPPLLSRLLNRQLPPALNDTLEQQDIHLFPDSWDDMNAHCSCPDWAVPCKHIAAVLYLLSNEIDKNPFEIFRLHGMDLVNAVEQHTGTTLQALSEPARYDADWHNEPQVDYWQRPDAHHYQNFDLSTVPELAERSFSILSSQTLFHPKSFHPILKAHCKRAAQVALRHLYPADPITPWASEDQLPDLQIVIDHHGVVLELLNQGETVDVSCQPCLQAQPSISTATPIEQLLQLLQGLNGCHDDRLSSQLLLWRQLYRLALKLVQQQAVVPAAHYNNDSALLIHWQPAPFCSEATALLDILADACPPDLVLMQADSASTVLFSDAQHQICSALQQFINSLIRQGFHRAPQPQQADPFGQLFCNQQHQQFERFDNLEQPRVIHHWLSPLYLTQRSHRLLIQINSIPAELDSFSLNIQVETDHSLQPLTQLLAEPELSSTRLAVLTDLALLSDYFPMLETLYNRTPATSITLTLEALSPVLNSVLPALEALGIRILLPKALQKLARPRLNLALDSDEEGGSENNLGQLDMGQLLSFNWQIALGDQRLSIDEFRQLLENSQGLVRLHDQYIMVDNQQLQQLLKKIDRLPTSLSGPELLRAGLSGELDGAGVDLSDRVQSLFDQLLNAPPTPLPDGIQAQLRPYQQRGFEWLVQNARLGFGSLLADDMGLGKTLQVISLLQHLKQHNQLAEQPALVVAPTTLLTNWQKELQHFAPDLSCQVYHGSQRDLKVARQADIILTSYGLARSDNSKLARINWQALILDEAQNIKNPTSQQTRAVKKLKANIRIGMSGTPVENRLSEYWSLFDFTNKGYLSTAKYFQDNYAGPIEKERDQQALLQFHQLTAPFILRRLKTDKTIISDLPDKLESNRYCQLSPEQAALYQATIDQQMALLEKVDEDIERRGLILKLLNALKQICNSPAQYLGHDQAVTDESGKLAALIELLREADEANEKVLIFTQYTQMGELLQKQIRAELDLEAPFFHGGLSRDQRDAMVDNFQQDNRTRLMILSLKAAGTGLNLTAASQVVHYDLWWNPAVEAQATDRAFRIGQQQRVLVHRLITEHSFEEKIDAMIQQKKELADLTVASGESWLTELSNDQLHELIRLN